MLDDSIRGFFDTNYSGSSSGIKQDDSISLAGTIASMTNDFESGMKRKSKRSSRASFLRKSTKKKQKNY